MNTIRIGALKRDDGLIQLTFTKAGPHEDPLVLDEDGARWLLASLRAALEKESASE